MCEHQINNIILQNKKKKMMKLYINNKDINKAVNLILDLNDTVKNNYDIYYKMFIDYGNRLKITLENKNIITLNVINDIE